MDKAESEKVLVAIEGRLKELEPKLKACEDKTVGETVSECLEIGKAKGEAEYLKRTAVRMKSDLEIYGVAVGVGSMVWHVSGKADGFCERQEKKKLSKPLRLMDQNEKVDGAVATQIEKIGEMKGEIRADYFLENADKKAKEECEKEKKTETNIEENDETESKQ
jgi:hypothetical protein